MIFLKFSIKNSSTACNKSLHVEQEEKQGERDSDKPLSALEIKKTEEKQNEKKNVIEFINHCSD